MTKFEKTIYTSLPPAMTFMLLRAGVPPDQIPPLGDHLNLMFTAIGLGINIKGMMLRYNVCDPVTGKGRYLICKLGDAIMSVTEINGELLSERHRLVVTDEFEIFGLPVGSQSDFLADGVAGVPALGVEELRTTVGLIFAGNYEHVLCSEMLGPRLKEREPYSFELGTSLVEAHFLNPEYTGQVHRMLRLKVATRNGVGQLLHTLEVDFARFSPNGPQRQLRMTVTGHDAKPFALGATRVETPDLMLQAILSAVDSYVNPRGPLSS